MCCSFCSRYGSDKSWTAAGATAIVGFTACRWAGVRLPPASEASRAIWAICDGSCRRLRQTAEYSSADRIGACFLERSEGGRGQSAAPGRYRQPQRDTAGFRRDDGRDLSRHDGHSAGIRGVAKTVPHSRRTAQTGRDPLCRSKGDQGSGPFRYSPCAPTNRRPRAGDPIKGDTRPDRASFFRERPGPERGGGSAGQAVAAAGNRDRHRA